MPPAVKSLLALVGAVALVVGAIVVRSSLDEKKVNDAIVVRLTCDPALADACTKAAAADSRIKLATEAPEKTRARLRGLASGTDPGLDAWLTVGPWMAMTDGDRTGQPPLSRASRAVASTRVTLVERPDLAVCKPTPLSCADKVRTVGMGQPPSDGVALAAAASIVALAGGVPVAGLDRAELTTGKAADPLRQLKDKARPIGLEAVNASFASAQIVVTTAAAAKVVPAGRATVVPIDVNAVAEASFLVDSAQVPLAADTPAGRALRDALVQAGWDGAPQPSGLPDAGVLAALQDAWKSA